jgi:hypothetical protein
MVTVIIGVITLMDKFYTKLNKAIDKKLSGLRGPEGNSSNNGSHPCNWNDDQYIEFAKRWINELARMTEWRDGKGYPPFASDKTRVEKLAGIQEPVLKECVRYRTTVEEIDFWMLLTPEQRYQQAKKEWSNHQCGVHKRYGLRHYNPDKPGCSADKGCIEECIYYPDTGSIDDNELLSWYRHIIGNRTYEELRYDNDVFVQDFAKLLKKQAHEIPMTIPYSNDYFKEYYPSIMDL